VLRIKELLYKRLLKLFPGGLTFPQLKRRVPRQLRGDVKKALKELISEKVVKRKKNGKVYVICKKMI